MKGELGLNNPLITLFSIKLTEKLTVNQTTLTALTLMGGSVTLLLGTNSAQAALIYDNIGAPLDGSNAMNISDFAMADDFTVTEAVDLTDFTFWAFGLDNDSDLSDSIGWAIFNNNPGAVGSLIASGTDSTVTKTDTGLDSKPLAKIFYAIIKGYFFANLTCSDVQNI